MTVAQWNALEEQWAAEPMTHLMLAEFFGVKGKKKSRAPAAAPATAEALAQMFPGGSI